MPAPGPSTWNAKNRVYGVDQVAESKQRANSSGTAQIVSSCRPRSRCQVSGESSRAVPPAATVATTASTPKTTKPASTRSGRSRRASSPGSSPAGHSFTAAPAAASTPLVPAQRAASASSANPASTAETRSNRVKVSGPSSGTSTSQSRTPCPRPTRHSPATKAASRTTMSATKIDAYVHGVIADSQRGVRKTRERRQRVLPQRLPTGTPPNMAASWLP